MKGFFKLHIRLHLAFDFPLPGQHVLVPFFSRQRVTSQASWWPKSLSAPRSGKPQISKGSHNKWLWQHQHHRELAQGTK